MKLFDFHIGGEFWMGGRRWRCTDVGTRVATAICLEEPQEVVRYDCGVKRMVPVTDEERSSWHRGPPYKIEESVVDEYDMQGCRPTEAAWREDFGDE